MNEIFINYRKSDEPFAAALIDAKLCERFGADRIFRDSRTIPPGVDFEPRLWGTLARSAALVVVVGRRWLESGPTGERYVDSPDDFARREIAFALRAGVRVVPVLVDGTPNLRAEELPEDIRALARCQYRRLGPRTVEDDLRRIADDLGTIMRASATKHARGTVLGIEADGADTESVRAAVRAAVAGCRLVAKVVIRDREHGVAVIAPEGVPPITVLSELVPALRARLTVLDEATARPTQQVRIRIAVDRGAYGEDGDVSGEAIEAVDRLLAAPGLRQVFDSAPAVRLAVAASDRYYRDVVIPAYAFVDASTFARFRVGAADTGEVGWLQVPGSSAPPRSAYSQPEPPASAAQAPSQQHRNGRSNVNYGTVEGDQNYYAGDAVARDKHVHYGTRSR